MNQQEISSIESYENEEIKVKEIIQPKDIIHIKDISEPKELPQSKSSQFSQVRIASLLSLQLSNIQPEENESLHSPISPNNSNNTNLINTTNSITNNTNNNNSSESFLQNDIEISMITPLSNKTRETIQLHKLNSNEQFDQSIIYKRQTKSISSLDFSSVERFNIQSRPTEILIDPAMQRVYRGHENGNHCCSFDDSSDENFNENESYSKKRKHVVNERHSCIELDQDDDVENELNEEQKSRKRKKEIEELKLFASKRKYDYYN